MTEFDLNFTPIERELHLDSGRVMICKFNAEGIIEYVNDYFVGVTGFEVHEIVGNTINTLKHDEMPLTIFSYILEHIERGENINIVLKGQSRDGRFYWSFADFEFKKDEEGVVVSFLCNRRSVPIEVVNELEPLYQRLLKIEKFSGMKTAINFFEGYLEEKNMSFDQLTKSILDKYVLTKTIDHSLPNPFHKNENKPFLVKLFKK